MNKNECGRLGGLKRGHKYLTVKQKARYLYIKTDLKQEEIAEMLGIHQSTVSRSLNFKVYKVKGNLRNQNADEVLEKLEDLEKFEHELDLRELFLIQELEKVKKGEFKESSTRRKKI